MCKCTAIVVCTRVSAETGGKLWVRALLVVSPPILFIHSFIHLFERNLPLNLELTDEDK